MFLRLKSSDMSELLFYTFYNLFEYIGIVMGYVGQDFTVQFYVGFVKLVYQSAITNAVFSGGGIYLGLPKSSEVALFLFSISELKCPSMKQSFFGLSVFGLSCPHKTFCMFQQTFSSGIGNCSSFDSWQFSGQWLAASGQF